MIKAIRTVGNFQSITFDTALMDLARLNVGNQIKITFYKSNAICFTPVRPVAIAKNGHVRN